MQTIQGYLGTYTKKDSLGIYHFTIDSEKEIISSIQLAAQLENPTYLAINEEKNMLYSVIKKEDLGGIAAFSIEKETGKLHYQGELLTKGSPPCYVSAGTKNLYAFSAYYHRGTVESYRLTNDGKLQEITSIVEHNKSGQTESHVHFISYTPDEKYVIAVDLGCDVIFTYQLTNGHLHEVERLFVKKNTGPRHLAFHPNGKFAYCITELSSEIITLAYNNEYGCFTELQYIGTLPEDFSGHNQGSAIHISSDGKFLYAGNRGHNSIAVFQVNEETGYLIRIDVVPTYGNWPRDFSLDPTEKFLIAANQESDTIVLFRRNKETGTLSSLQSIKKVPNPVCIKFLPAYQ